MMSRRQYMRYLSIASITACCCEGLREEIPLLVPICIWMDRWMVIYTNAAVLNNQLYISYIISAHQVTHLSRLIFASPPLSHLHHVPYYYYYHYYYYYYYYNYCYLLISTFLHNFTLIRNFTRLLRSKFSRRVVIFSCRRYVGIDVTNTTRFLIQIV